MEKTVCGGRGVSDTKHKQQPDTWVNGLDVHNRNKGVPKASPSPGTVGIIDGEREPLPG